MNPKTPRMGTRHPPTTHTLWGGPSLTHQQPKDTAQEQPHVPTRSHSTNKPKTEGKKFFPKKILYMGQAGPSPGAHPR